LLKSLRYASEMAVSILIERSRLGKVFFDLREEHLSISGRRMFFPVDDKIDLGEVSPDFDVHQTRYYRYIFAFGGVGLAALAVAVAMITQRWVTVEGLSHFIIGIGGFGAGNLGMGLMWIPRVTVIRFKTYDGDIAFEMIRDPGKTSEMDAYLVKITDAIIRARRRR
jgi:hypothetical protein